MKPRTLLLGGAICVCLLTAWLSVHRMTRARGSPNYGSAVLALDRGTEWVAARRAEDPRWSFDPDSVDGFRRQLEEMGLGYGLRIYRNTNGNPLTESNRIAMLWDLPVAGPGVSLKHVGLLSGQVCLVRTQHAVLGALCPSNRVFRYVQ